MGDGKYNIPMDLTYTWLGVAGLRFSCAGYTLLVDPFFTRPSKGMLLADLRVRSNTRLVEQHAPRADAVLVTHPHYDHLLDVPGILLRTGAPGFGSENTCAILALHGIPAEQRRLVTVGDSLELGPFRVEVLPASHTRIPMRRLFNGPLPRRLRQSARQGPLGGSHRLPLRLTDYRMDACYSFLIHADGHSLLVGNHPAPADVVFLAPYQASSRMAESFAAACPRRVVLIHWDDFMRPLARPLLPMLLTRAQGLRSRFPILRRMDIAALADELARGLPHSQVQVPVLFREEKIS